MRLKGKTGVPMALANNSERFIDDLNATFFQKRVRTEVDNDRREPQPRFFQNRRLTLRGWSAKKLLNSLSDFPGEHQTLTSKTNSGYVSIIIDMNPNGLLMCRLTKP